MKTNHHKNIGGEKTNNDKLYLVDYVVKYIFIYITTIDAADGIRIAEKRNIITHADQCDTILEISTYYIDYLIIFIKHWGFLFFNRISYQNKLGELKNLPLQKFDCYVRNISDLLNELFNLFFVSLI